MVVAFVSWPLEAHQDLLPSIFERVPDGVVEAHVPTNHREPDYPDRVEALDQRERNHRVHRRRDRASDFGTRSQKLNNRLHDWATDGNGTHGLQAGEQQDLLGFLGGTYQLAVDAGPNPGQSGARCPWTATFTPSR